MKKGNKKENVIILFADFIEENIKPLSIIILASIVVIPVLLFILECIFKINLPCGDILAYFASILAGITSFMISIVALSQTEKNEKLHSDIASYNRQKSIKPHLQVVLEKISDEAFSVGITNNGKGAATHINLYDHYFLQAIRPYETEKVNVKTDELRMWREEYGKKLILTKYGYPKIIKLHYYDIDLNDIYQDFIYIGNGIYETHIEDYLDSNSEGYYGED